MIKSTTFFQFTFLHYIFIVLLLKGLIIHKTYMKCREIFINISISYNFLLISKQLRKSCFPVFLFIYSFFVVKILRLNSSCTQLHTCCLILHTKYIKFWYIIISFHNQFVAHKIKILDFLSTNDNFIYFR